MAKRKDSTPSDTQLTVEAVTADSGTPPAAGDTAENDTADIRLDQAPEVSPPAGTSAPATDQAETEGNVVSIAAPETDGPAITPLDRARRNPLLNWLHHRVATVAIAAAIGAIAGTVMSNGVGYVVSAATSERQSIDQAAALRASLSQLTGEVAALRAAVSLPPGESAAPVLARRADISPETTGSIPPTPVAEGWALLRVERGRALVRGAGGHFEVIPGSTLPGLGMVQRILRQNGEWIVQTRNGVIRYQG